MMVGSNSSKLSARQACHVHACLSLVLPHEITSLQVSRTYLSVIPWDLTNTIQRQGMLGNSAASRLAARITTHRLRDTDSTNLLRASTPKTVPLLSKMATRPAQIGRCRHLLAGRSAATPASASLIGRAPIDMQARLKQAGR
jgi:hypothetical protein